LSNLHALALKNRGCPEFTVPNIYISVYYYSGVSSNFVLALKNRVALEFFTVLKYFLSFRIFEQLALALKNRVAPKCFAVWNILFTFRIFWAICACPEKQSCPDIFHCIWTCIFYHSGFLSNLRLPWKTELRRSVSLYGIHFLHSEFLSNLRLPWKTEGALIFFTVLNMYLLSFRIFEQLALALKNRVALEFFSVWNILFTFRMFEQLALALENRECPEIFRCIEYIFYYSGVLSNLRLPWKTEGALIFFTVLNIYFLLFRIFEQLALALENRGCPGMFHCMEYTFYTQEFWETCMRLPWKTKGALIFFTVLNMYLLSFRIFEQLALALKNRVAQKFFSVWNILFTFRMFEQLALALENRGCPEIFRCIEYIFYYSGVLSNLRLHWKQNCPGIFHCTEIYFIIQDFWATCGCHENRVCPEIFQARGRGRPPASYAYALTQVTYKRTFSWKDKLPQNTLFGGPLLLHWNGQDLTAHPSWSWKICCASLERKDNFHPKTALLLVVCSQSNVFLHILVLCFNFLSKKLLFSGFLAFLLASNGRRYTVLELMWTSACIKSFCKSKPVA